MKTKGNFEPSPHLEINRSLGQLVAAHPDDEALRIRTSIIKQNLDLGLTQLAAKNVDDLGRYLRGDYGPRPISRNEQGTVGAGDG